MQTENVNSESLESSETVVYRQFQSDTPAEKRAEVYALAQELHLSPERALIRIFNGALSDIARTSGTDRAGVDENDLRPLDYDKNYGYADALKERGLRLEDGFYAVPLNEWKYFASHLFEGDMLDIPAHRIAISIYDGAEMVPIPKGFSTPEFYHFKDPSHKLNALKGMLVQKPLEIEEEFARLTTDEEKMTFIQKLLPTLNPENLGVIRGFIFDTQRSIALRTNTFGGLGRQSDDVKKMQSSLEALMSYVKERKYNFYVLDDLRGSIAYCKSGKGTRSIVDSIQKRISKELERDDIPDVYRQELQQVALETDNL